MIFVPRSVEKLLLVMLAGCARSSGMTASPDGSSGPADARSSAPGGPPGSPDAGATGNTATVHFVGRVDLSTPSAPRYAWSGTAVLARFTGTGISVALTDGYANQLAVYLDGAVTSTV